LSLDKQNKVKSASILTIVLITRWTAHCCRPVS